MGYLIINADPARAKAEGMYLAAYDPDWRPDCRARYPTGHVVWTDDPAKALHHATPEEAMERWRATSTKVPTRPDGGPNRPLTAYTVGIEWVDAP